MEDLTNVIYITEDTYSRMTGKRLSIDPQEIAFCRIITASYHIGDTAVYFMTSKIYYKIVH